MKKRTGPKSLNDKITEATKGMKCPIHQREAKILTDEVSEEATAECCCNSFKTDVMVVIGRVLRAWKLHGEHLRDRRKEY